MPKMTLEEIMTTDKIVLTPEEACGVLGCTAQLLRMRARDPDKRRTLGFPIMADYALLPVGERLIYATHGHHFNMGSLPPLQPGDILLHGHTHIPAWDGFGEGNLYLNPGSVSIPKAGSKNSYMILQDNCAVWKSLDGTVYHTETL